MNFTEISLPLESPVSFQVMVNLYSFPKTIKKQLSTVQIENEMRVVKKGG